MPSRLEVVISAWVDGRMSECEARNEKRAAGGMFCDTCVLGSAYKVIISESMRDMVGDGGVDMGYPRKCGVESPCFI